MKHYIFTTILLITLLISCKEIKYQKIKADLTFQSISFANAYGANDKQYLKLTKDIENVLNGSKNSDKETLKLYKHFSKLKKHNLLKSPYIFLSLERDSVITVFLSEKEYQKVKNIKHIDLLKKNKKVIIELDLEEKDSSVYYSNNIIKVIKT